MEQFIVQWKSAIKTADTPPGGSLMCTLVQKQKVSESSFDPSYITVSPAPSVAHLLGNGA